MAEKVVEEETVSPAPFWCSCEAGRVHQWMKHLLVFVPLLMVHRWSDLDWLLEAVLALLAISFCASAVHIRNDLADLDADRLHPTKRHRTLANGNPAIPVAMRIVPILLALSATLSSFPSLSNRTTMSVSPG